MWNKLFHIFIKRQEKEMGSIVRTEKKVEFHESPLGIRLEEIQFGDVRLVTVGEILKVNDTTRYIKEGWILTKVNSADITNLRLHEVQRLILMNSVGMSRAKPLVIYFLDPTDATPLFSPFIERRSQSQSIYASDQRAAMVDAVKIDESITTLPSVDGAAAVPPSESQNVPGHSAWQNANDVINVNDLRKRIINVDSEFRTDARMSPANFYFKVVPPIKNVIRIRMASLELQNTFYTFTTLRGNTSLRLTDYTVDISEGNYTPQQLIKAIKTVMDAQTPSPQYDISLNPVNGLVTINNLAATAFTMDFSTTYPVPFFWGLGYNLGFRKQTYSSKTTYTSESVINTSPDPYIFLQINDFNNVEQQLYKGEKLEAFAKIILTNGKFTETFDDTRNFLTKEIIFSQPTNISNLEIRLVDRYGNPIQTPLSEWSMALEVTDVMNGRLYDFYRNYLFKRDAKF
jgi:hypothetical protein